MMKNPLSQKLVQLEQAEYRFSIKLMTTQTLRIFLHQSFYLIYLRKGTLQDIYVINLQQHLPMPGKRYVLVHNDIAMSNSDFPDDLRTHSHEEADTLIILHAIDVAKENPFTQLYISCSDTDVFFNVA